MSDFRTDNTVISRGVHVGDASKQSEVVFVDTTETAIARVCNTINDSKTDRCEIVITGKRIYVTETTKKGCHENIVDIDTVQYVDFVHSTYRPHKGISLIVFGIMFLLAGAALGYLLELAPLYGICGVGLVLFVVGLVLNRKRNRHDLIIGSSVNPINVVVDRFKKEEVRNIQKAVFAALDKNKAK